MQRYFVEAKQFIGNRVTLLGDDAHHLQRVMRAEAGDQIIVSDGVGREVLAEVAEMDKGSVTAIVIEERAMTQEPSIKVWVAQGLPKADKMETVIQKCTELGAVRFVPFESERTVVQYDAKKESRRLERWSKIAKEAAEQAHRNVVPVLDSPCTWKQLLKLVQVEGFDAVWICYERESGAGFKPSLRKLAETTKHGQVMRVLIIVGPEGGFTEREVAEIQAAGGASISLGRRILRTETAAMAALACILYEFDEIGGH